MALAYPSTLVLIGVNLIPLGFVIYGDWSAFQLLLAYWWEGVILSITAFAKVNIVRNGPAEEDGAWMDVFDVPRVAFFFVTALIAVVYVWLIGGLALNYDGTVESFNQVLRTHPLDALDWMVTTTATGSMAIVISGWLASHGFSFWNNFFQKNEMARTASILQTAMARISIPQIIVFGLIVISLNRTSIGLWVTVVVKVVFDLLAHALERMFSNPSRGESKEYVP